MRRRRLVSLPVLFLACSTAAAAQSSRAALVARADPALNTLEPAPGLPDFRMPRGDYRQPPGPVRNGLIGALPLGRNLQVAVGRFIVPELARPRTHMETDRRPADVRPRDRGIAAVGFSFRF
ncbi:MAG TPA: hypothetical protein VEW71_03270 [Allosphingosinicella sp.]|nr:hypothetical protein [Allosphingosinicella sp.]